MKLSHLSSYVKGTVMFPKMVAGTQGNVCDSYRDNFKVKLIYFCPGT